MRYSIKYQIITLFVVVAVATVAILTAVNGYLSWRRSEQTVRLQLSRVAETLTDSGFPITNSTLIQVKQLSGTELLLMDNQQQLAASTLPNPSEDLLAEISLHSQGDSENWNRPIGTGDARFYLASTNRIAQTAEGRPGKLYVLYPRQNYLRQMRAAWLPPVISGILATLLVAAVGWLSAGHWTRRLSRLRDQVNVIAEGNFSPMNLPKVNDEIQDLSLSVNQMAQQLQEYEKVVRETEREKTFNQIGRGIAHEIRNAVAGGRIALSLHQKKNAHLKGEYLDVVSQQLYRMESSINRLLRMGETNPRNLVNLDFAEVVEGAIRFAQPVAEHLGVKIEYSRQDQKFPILGDSSDLEQAVLNLIQNAVQAAAQNTRDPTESDGAFRVRVELESTDSAVILHVRDSGLGPSTEIAESMFEPFQTSKPEGIGLGLPLTRQIAQVHRGSLDWGRQGDWTWFGLTLPTRGDSSRAEP